MTDGAQDDSATAQSASVTEQTEVLACHPFNRPTQSVTYRCGNSRSVYSGVPDRCPRCGAGVVSR